MKKNSVLLSLLTFVTVVFSCFSLFFPKVKKTAAYSSDWDYIESMETTIQTNNDGSLEVEYNIAWKVLYDGGGSELLEDVYIGVPNKYVSHMYETSTNVIYSLKYKDSNGNGNSGAFIHIKFDRGYYNGEIVKFAFSFHQTRIFTPDERNGQITYEFKPSYFSAIRIGKETVKWKKGPALGVSNYMSEDDNYYIWEKENLYYGARLDCDISFEQSYFTNIDLSKSYSDAYDDPSDMIVVLCIFGGMVAFLAIVFTLAKRAQRNSYGYYRGFSGPSYWGHGPGFRHRPYHGHPGGYSSSGKSIAPTSVNSHVSSSSYHSGGGHSCACACACACAGGGRAGCSRKDFVYTDKDETPRIIKKLTK